MRFRIFLLAVILLSLPISIQAQTVTVPLIFQTGQDPDGDSLFIQVQIATDSLFVSQLILTNWFFVQPNSQFTYQADFPSNISSQKYWWRGRHRDHKNNLSVWCLPFWFILKVNQPPSGCACVSPAKGEVISR